MSACASAGMKRTSLTGMSSSLMPSGSRTIFATLPIVAAGIGSTRGRTVAICGRCFLHRMVAIRFPPKVGRVAARTFFSGSMASSVQSAVSPVLTRVAIVLARSRPRVVAPTRKISGRASSPRSPLPMLYGRLR